MQNKLKDLRIAKGLTQLELARKLPIDTGILTGRVSAISKIETGCALPTYHFREAIAAVLGCQPEEICDAVDGNQLTRRTEIAEEMIKKREKKIKKRVAEAEHLQSIGHCKGCKYWRTLGMRGANLTDKLQFACHYLYDTGRMRGCPPSQCVHNVATK